MPNDRVLRVADVGEYIHYSSCERRFKLAFNNRAASRNVPFMERLFNSLDPVLKAEGRRREDDWQRALDQAAKLNLSTASTNEEQQSTTTTWAAFLERLSTLPVGQDAYAREVEVMHELGAFTIQGRVDFMLIRWEDGVPILRLVECKSSRRDRSYHRIQVALYRMIVRALNPEQPISIGGVSLQLANIEGSVARIEESTNQAQDILQLPALNLAMEEADLNRMLEDGGAFERILNEGLNDLPYQLEAKCDPCVFSVHCFPESARLRNLALLGIEASAARALAEAGVGNIDELAGLDVDGPIAREIRDNPGFVESLERLQTLARVRRVTLPRTGDQDPDRFQAQSIPRSGRGQLPPHEVNQQRVIRVYMAVDYDYAENRIGALSAHVTSSDWKIHANWNENPFRPLPGICERGEIRTPGERTVLTDPRPVQGSDVIKIATVPWTGELVHDSALEEVLISDFFRQVVSAIRTTARTSTAPIHFYVWSRSEMSRLVEACSRAHTNLLTHLRELLGCRESLEQLLFSSVGEEIDDRFAIAWTGRGLVVASGIPWFGRRYHWKRNIHEQTVDLDHEFTQDLFDFKTTLDVNPDGSWASPSDGTKHRFEIRSRFFDSLPVPYLRAYWQTLTRPEDGRGREREQLRRYYNAATPAYLEEYLKARVHALRFVEEAVSSKNYQITKPPLVIAELPTFTLSTTTPEQASIDFLKLDQHVTVNAWIAEHLKLPVDRIARGVTLPLRNLVATSANVIEAVVDSESFGMSLEAIAERSQFGEGDFVRVTPRPPDAAQGQSFYDLLWAASTCIIDALNWETGDVQLRVIYMEQNEYALKSVGVTEGQQLPEYATVDTSPSDFVGRRVESRLRDFSGTYATRWFDQSSPDIPAASALPAALKNEIEAALSSYETRTGQPLNETQRRAVIEGLDSRVHLLQGPPGTGKTATTAVAILARAVAHCSPGDVVFIASFTNTAVRELMERLNDELPRFRAHSERSGMNLPPIQLYRVHSGEWRDASPLGIEDVAARTIPINTLRQQLRSGVVIFGGTTNSLLSLVSNLNNRRSIVPLGSTFLSRLLVIDEASMMIYPHFLSLATAVREDGFIMLAGDHRQLSPIVSHDWDNEDRPPTVLYQPFASAFEAVDRIQGNLGDNAKAHRSALEFSFRLPPAIRNLIGRVYDLDHIALAGPPRSDVELDSTAQGLAQIWASAHGLFLLVHDERGSRQSNPTEVQIIRELLSAADSLALGSVSVITPHRAQRVLLRRALSEEIEEGTIRRVDTVESMQGDEGSSIIVSGTASDPSAIASRVRFLLDLNRSNVAFSRTQDRLIVVCAETLLDHVPTDFDDYSSSMLWKSLRNLCTRELYRFVVNGHAVRLLTPERSELDSLENV